MRNSMRKFYGVKIKIEVIFTYDHVITFSFPKIETYEITEKIRVIPTEIYNYIEKVFIPDFIDKNIYEKEDYSREEKFYHALQIKSINWELLDVHALGLNECEEYLTPEEFENYRNYKFGREIIK